MQTGITLCTGRGAQDIRLTRCCQRHSTIESSAAAPLSESIAPEATTGCCCEVDHLLQTVCSPQHCSCLAASSQLWTHTYVITPMLAERLMCGVSVAETANERHVSARSLWGILDALPADVRAAAKYLAVDGMSATALLVDGRSGEQLAAPMLYNDSQPADVVTAVKVLLADLWYSAPVSQTGNSILLWHYIDTAPTAWPSVVSCCHHCLEQGTCAFDERQGGDMRMSWQVFAPEHHTATAPTSTLCKVAFWEATGVLEKVTCRQAEPSQRLQRYSLNIGIFPGTDCVLCASKCQDAKWCVPGGMCWS